MSTLIKHIGSDWWLAVKLYRRHVLDVLCMIVVLLLVMMVLAVIMLLFNNGFVWLLDGYNGMLGLAVASSAMSLMMMFASVVMLRWLLERFRCDTTGIDSHLVWFALRRRLLSYLIYVCYMLGFFLLYRLSSMGIALFMDGWQPFDVYRLLVGGLMLCWFVPCTYVAVSLPMSIFYMLYQQPGFMEINRQIKDAARAAGHRGVMLVLRLMISVMYQVVVALPLRACLSAMCLVKPQWWRVGVTIALPSVSMFWGCQWLLRAIALHGRSEYLLLMMPWISFIVYVLCGAFVLSLYCVVFHMLQQRQDKSLAQR